MLRTKIKTIKKSVNLKPKRIVLFDENINNNIKEETHEESSSENDTCEIDNDIYEDMTDKEKEIYEIDITFIKNGYTKYKYLNNKIIYELLSKSFKLSCFDKNFIIPNKKFFEILYPKFSLNKYKTILQSQKIDLSKDEEYMIHFHNYGLYEIKNKSIVLE